MKYFKGWRKFLNESVDPYAETAETQVQTKIAKPKAKTDEYDSPYEYEETPEKSRETYFGKSPDNLRCIKDLRNQAIDVFPPDFYRCMEQEGYTKLGAGSFRAVFNVPENPELVLKVVGPANSYPEQIRSREMNKEEAKASFQTASDLVPKVFDSARDYFWIISEKVTPILTWEEMKKFFPAWKDENEYDFSWWFQKLILSELNNEVAIRNLDNRIEYVKTGKELVNDPLILQIRDLLAQFDLPAWDIRPHNVGYATRNGQKQFVILDPGFELGKATGTVADQGPEPSISDIFKDDVAKTWKPQQKDKNTTTIREDLTKNWQLFVENAEIKGPNDFLYDITASPDKITINLLDSVTKEPVESKKEDTNAYISMEKRTNVPNWEVAWSSSPLNSEKVGIIMYLMALELVEEGLSPDSYETSPDALRIWAKFMKKNEYGVKKELKDGHEGQDEEDPVNFVFFKPNKAILEQYSDKITVKEVESEEKDEFDPKKEEKFEYFDTEAFDWEDLDELDEQTEPYQLFSIGTYKDFIKDLANQGKNKYNIGGKMKKASNKHLKSGPLGG